MVKPVVLHINFIFQGVSPLISRFSTPHVSLL